MSLTWAVIIIDRVSVPGTERQQDMVLAQAIDMEKSRFHATTSPKPTASHMHLTFPTATPSLNIREMMEVWAGWRDSSTGVWSLVDWSGQPAPPFGGYIVALHETVEGGEKVFDCTLSDYGILLTKTPVLGWPTFVTTARPPDYVGVQPGYTVEEWLAGAAGPLPFNGVVRAHLGNGTRYDGIDPMFSTIVFNADTLPGFLDVVPGLSNLQGYFGSTRLDKIILSLADAAQVTYAKNYSSGPELVVGYWMSALPGSDPTRIVPQFCFRNVADLITAPDLAVAAAWPLNPGEILMGTPHSHERDANDIQTRVVFFGIGGDLTLPGTPLVYADYSQADHLAAYPTTYQVTPGWGGDPVFLPLLHTRQLAHFLAQVAENRVWGAKGSIEFYLDQPVVPGMRLRVRDPNEALDRVFICTDAEDMGDGSWRVRVGFTQPTIPDVLKGGLPDVLLWREDLAYQTEALGSSRAQPGTPRQTAPDLMPGAPHRNHITAGYTDTTGLTVQSSLQVRLDFNGVPIPSVPVPSFQVLPPVLPDGTQPPPGLYTTPADARPHPQQFHAVYATGDVGGNLFALRAVAAFQSLQIVGLGQVTVTRDNVAVAGPYVGTVAGSIYPLTPAITGTPRQKFGFTLSAVTTELLVCIDELLP